MIIDFKGGPALPSVKITSEGYNRRGVEVSGRMVTLGIAWLNSSLLTMSAGRSQCIKESTDYGQARSCHYRRDMGYNITHSVYLKKWLN